MFTIYHSEAFWTFFFPKSQFINHSFSTFLVISLCLLEFLKYSDCPLPLIAFWEVLLVHSIPFLFQINLESFLIITNVLNKRDYNSAIEILDSCKIVCLFLQVCIKLLVETISLQSIFHIDFFNQLVSLLVVFLLFQNFCFHSSVFKDYHHE